MLDEGINTILAVQDRKDPHVFVLSGFHLLGAVNYKPQEPYRPAEALEKNLEPI